MPSEPSPARLRTKFRLEAMKALKAHGVPDEKLRLDVYLSTNTSGHGGSSLRISWSQGQITTDGSTVTVEVDSEQWSASRGQYPSAVAYLAAFVAALGLLLGHGS